MAEKEIDAPAKSEMADAIDEGAGALPEAGLAVPALAADGGGSAGSGCPGAQPPPPPTVTAAGEQEQLVPFSCSLCGLSELCHYRGTRPGFTRSVQLREPSYVMRDPFAARGAGQLLLLGSDCAVCGRAVCQDAACSVFYARRFCVPCARQHAEEFPPQLRAKIGLS